MNTFEPVRHVLLGAAIAAAGVVALPATARAGDWTEAVKAPAASHDVVIVRLADPPAAQAGLPVGDEDGQLDLAAPETVAYREGLLAQQQQLMDWLAAQAPAARVIRQWTVVFNGVAVELRGTDAALLDGGPNVTGVTFSRFFIPAMNVSGGVVGASTLWDLAGGAASAGAGIKVGIIDSGIDPDHPFLTDTSLSVPAGFPKCDMPENCAQTSEKVIVAREYPKSDTYDASDQNGHGTHVSGTVAGIHGHTIARAATPLSGVAPKAWLGNYNVFPGSTGSATEQDIIDALEDAVADRMNVLNMSLGGDALPPELDPLAEAVDNTVAAGLVVAVAAGNSGPGSETIGSPGVAEGAITVGATTNPHFEGISVQSPIGDLGAALGDFVNFDPPVSATYGSWLGGVQGEGCEPIAQDLQGKIALIRRGGCTFTTKIRNAQGQGAVGVLLFNQVAGDPVAMGHDGTEPKPTIPAAMVSLDRGKALRAHGGGPLTVDGTASREFFTQNVDIIAGFSSRGPTPWSYRIKPDLTAPGVNVLSSTPGNGHAYFQGTSMATPHVAGAAAVLRQVYGKKTSPAHIKSALATTARRPVFEHVTGTKAAERVMDRGAGRMDLTRAGSVGVTFAPTNAGFGVSLAGQTLTRTIRVTSRSGRQDLTVSVTPPGEGVQVSVTPGQLSLKNGETAEVTVTMIIGADAAGEYEGDVVFSSGGSTFVVPYWTAVSFY